MFPRWWGYPRHMETVGEQVHAALRGLMRWASRGGVWTEMVAGTRLSPVDAFLLEAVATSGPLRVTDLAAWQGVDKSTVTPQVRRLEAAGLVRRGPDPSDGRAALLTVTDAGRALHAAMGTGGARLVDDLIAGWPEEDQRELGRLMGRLAAEIGAPTPRNRSSAPSLPSEA